MKIIEVKDTKYEVIREVPSDTEVIDKIKIAYEDLFNAITLINNKATNTTLFCRKAEEVELEDEENTEDGEIDESEEVSDEGIDA